MNTPFAVLAAGILTATPAAADIVYTDPPDVVVGSAGPWDAMFDVDSDGTDDFNLHFESLGCDCDSAWGGWLRRAPGRADAKVCADGQTPPFAVGFAEGTLITGDPATAADAELAVFMWGIISGHGVTDYSEGEWAQGDCGLTVSFAGLVFDIDGAQHLGWARIGVNCGDESVTLYDFAYESDPGVPILAGATGLCTPDCNKDGLLNINDFVCFQAEWRKRSAYGDYNGDGKWNINDFIAFQAEFRMGCP